MPAGFLAGLRTLRWLDLRGGVSSDLECLTGCHQLQGLVVNQVRGLREARAVASLTGLEILSLYGLAQIQSLPDLAALPRLRHLRLGQLRSLQDWAVLARLPAIEELIFVNKLDPELDVMRRLSGHPLLRAFGWWAPDEPAAKVDAVTQAVGRPPPALIRPEQWFARNCG